MLVETQKVDQVNIEKVKLFSEVYPLHSVMHVCSQS